MSRRIDSGLIKASTGKLGTGNCELADALEARYSTEEPSAVLKRDAAVA